VTANVQIWLLEILFHVSQSSELSRGLDARIFVFDPLVKHYGGTITGMCHDCSLQYYFEFIIHVIYSTHIMLLIQKHGYIIQQSLWSGYINWRIFELVLSRTGSGVTVKRRAFGLTNEFIRHLKFLVTRHSLVNSQFQYSVHYTNTHTHTHTHTQTLSTLGFGSLHQLFGRGFQRRTFPFLVPKTITAP
jgi:hypothetical protein